MSDSSDVLKVEEKEQKQSRSAFIYVALFAFLGILAAAIWLGVNYADIKKNGPRCDFTSQCEDGNFCVSGHCKAKCTKDNQCPGDKVCVDGDCKIDDAPGECAKDSDCGTLRICENQKCVYVSCLSDKGCDADGYECKDGKCAAVPFISRNQAIWITLGFLAAIVVLMLLLFFIRRLAVYFYSARWVTFAAIVFILLGAGFMAAYLGILSSNGYINQGLKNLGSDIGTDVFFYLSISFFALGIIVLFLKSFGDGEYIDKALTDEVLFENALEKANNEDEQTQVDNLKQLYLNRENNPQDQEAYANLNSYVNWVNGHNVKSGFQIRFDDTRTEDEALEGRKPTQLQEATGSEYERKFENKYYTKENHVGTRGQLARSFEGKSKRQYLGVLARRGFTPVPRLTDSKATQLRDYSEKRGTNLENAKRN